MRSGGKDIYRYRGKNKCGYRLSSVAPGSFWSIKVFLRGIELCHVVSLIL